VGIRIETSGPVGIAAHLPQVRVAVVVVISET